jgi:hypothetical protein
MTEAGATDRRHHPRLRADVLWRSAELRAARRPVVDASQGGMRVYSDQLVPVGARFELELLIPGESGVYLLARVVRVSSLPQHSPSFCEVAFEFLAMTSEARGRLAACFGVGRPSQPGVDEQHGHQVCDVEEEHDEECLLQPSARVLLVRGPDGDRQVCDQNRDQDELLHRLAS